jgi:hypothetical protein
LDARLRLTLDDNGMSDDKLQSWSLVTMAVGGMTVSLQWWATTT